MKRFVRIITEKTDKKSNDPIHFDVVLDQDDRIVSDGLIFGYQADLSNRTFGYSYPFVVDSRGQVDYGSEVSGNRGETDVLDIPITVGALIHWFGGNWNEHYRIIEVRERLRQT